MGNDIKTGIGAAGTAAAGTASVVTLGKSSWLNEKTKEWAKYTSENWDKSITGNTTKTVYHTATSAGGITATAVTMGKNEKVNNYTKQQLKSLSTSATNTGREVWVVGKDIATSTPGVGHAIGGVQLVCGDTAGGRETMHKATRTTAVMGGGIAGCWAAGPVGAVVGGISGGAAFDGTDTAITSVSNKKYTPKGQIAALNKVRTGKGIKERAVGIFQTAVTATSDGLSGFSVGKLTQTTPTVRGVISSQSKFPTPSSEAKKFVIKSATAKLDKVAKKKSESKEESKTETLEETKEEIVVIEPELEDNIPEEEKQYAIDNGEVVVIAGPEVPKAALPAVAITYLIEKYYDIIPNDTALSKEALLLICSQKDCIDTIYTFFSEAVERLGWEHLDLEKVKSGEQALSDEEAYTIFLETIKYITEQCKELIPSFDQLPQNIQEVVIDMCYQMGIANLKSKTQLVDTISEVAKGTGAEKDILDEISKLKWAKVHKDKVEAYKKSFE